MVTAGASGPAAVPSAAVRAKALPRGEAAPSGSAPVADAISPFLRDMADPGVLQFLDQLDSGRPAPDAELTSQLLQAAVSAAADRNVSEALAALTQLAAADPQRASVLPTLPALAPIHREVHSLVTRLTEAARSTANERIARASLILDLAALEKPDASDIAAEAVLRIAGHMALHGEHEHAVRAGEIAQGVIDHYSLVFDPAVLGAVPVRISGTARMQKAPAASAAAGQATVIEIALAVRRHVAVRVRRMWVRAPLLVLLLTWLALGLGAGTASQVLRDIGSNIWLPATAFDVWGLGFLGLVGFGFYMRIRRVRFDSGAR